MAGCNNPTLYPIVLSSIDDECVFVEHDVSSGTLEETWPCPTFYWLDWVEFDIFFPNFSSVGVVSPDNSTTSDTSLIYITENYSVGLPGEETYGDQSNQWNEFVDVSSTDPLNMTIESKVGDDTFVFNANISAVDSSSASGTNFYVAHLDTSTITTNNSSWGATNGVTPFNVKVQPGIGGMLGTDLTGTLTDGHVLTYDSATRKWGAEAGGGGPDAVLREPDTEIESSITSKAGNVTLNLSGAAGSTDNILEGRLVGDPAGTPRFYVDSTGKGFFGKGISVETERVTNVGDPTAPTDAATKLYVDEATSGVSGEYVQRDGSVDFTGNQSMGSNRLTSVTDPTADQDAATRSYVDTLTTATSAVADIDHNSLDNLTTADPHTQYIYNAPASSNRNLITQGHSGRPPLNIKAHASNTVNLFEILDPLAAPAVYVDKDYILETSATIKGATVSGTSILGQTGTFDGVVSAVSATTGGAVPTNDFAFQRPFTHTAYRNGSFTDGQRVKVFINTTDSDANFVIPAGQTLKVLAAYGRCKSGSHSGTTTWTIGITVWDDQAHSTVAYHALASNTTTDTDAYINIEAQGTLDNPLASIAGDSWPVGMCHIKHEQDGGRPSASDKHTVMVYGVFV